MNTAFKKHFYSELMSINPSSVKSDVDTAFGFTTEDYIILVKNELSLQSFRIQAGNKLEVGWNSVVSSQDINFIEDESVVIGKYKSGPRKGQDKIDIVKTNKVKVGKNYRQIDHYFGVRRKVDGVWKLYRVYLESKCSLDFDSEKFPASNAKIKEVTKALGADEGAYFNPVLATIPDDLQARSSDIKIYGVKDMIDMLPNPPFTVEEYFDGLKQIKIDWINQLVNKNNETNS
jgi:hypothetical protein